MDTSKDLMEYSALFLIYYVPSLPKDKAMP